MIPAEKQWKPCLINVCLGSVYIFVYLKYHNVNPVKVLRILTLIDIYILQCLKYLDNKNVYVYAQLLQKKLINVGFNKRT